ncbi:HAD domain-containing protein [Burkholderia pseudomallei]|uniref:HAD domain-containing protein n=1 Tax=Burkholderia pseudomallei TaxID=28450 RepID=UPI0022DA0C62|nr:HAD domain-containing protein [Burkholderia pseudomallei]MDA0558329.1 HAD domain-containing protein [Burkholderia pseudomallei]
MAIVKARGLVLFTDFDGVLHAADEPALDSTGRLIANERLFAWLPILADILEPYPQVRLVVSSDWRRLLDDENLRLVLGPLGSRFAGIVETWGTSRADEILVEVRRRKLSRWLAIDDHPSVAIASRRDARFIACAPDTGLSAIEVQAALRSRLATTLASG